MKFNTAVKLVALLVLAFASTSCFAFSNYKKFEAKAKQSEAKTNLGALFTCEIAHYGEYNAYGSTFDALRWAPEGLNNYSYFVANDVIHAKKGGPYALPAGIRPTVTDQGFLIIAVGNIDKDPDLDVWTIDQNRGIFNVISDL